MSCTTREGRECDDDRRSRDGLRHAHDARTTSRRTTPGFATDARPTPELLADLTRRYDAIGGTSPLAAAHAPTRWPVSPRHSSDVAPGEFDVRFGSKYEPPLLETAAETFPRRRLHHVVGIVLAPHSSSMSTDQYMSARGEALGDDVEFIPIGAWWEVPGFLDIIAERVNDALDTIPDERRATTEVIFSAHSLPEKILATGDTYPEQLRESAERAAAARRRRAMGHRVAVGRAHADPWLGPDILQVLRDEARRQA